MFRRPLKLWSWMQRRRGVLVRGQRGGSGGQLGLPGQRKDENVPAGALMHRGWDLVSFAGGGNGRQAHF